MKKVIVVLMFVMFAFMAGSNKPVEAKVKMEKIKTQYYWFCDACGASDSCPCGSGKCTTWCPVCSGRLRWTTQSCFAY
jgi:hypothetical protein